MTVDCSTGVESHALRARGVGGLPPLRVRDVDWLRPWTMLFSVFVCAKKKKAHAEMHARNISVGLQSLDEVDLKEVFMMRPIMDEERSTVP